MCGKKNPIGLDITFFYTNGRIETTFTPRQEHAGYKDIVHGGILATLLDETMGWASVISRPTVGLAAELSIRYKVSAKAGERLVIYGELVKDRRRVIISKGGVMREDGTILCTGEGKYIPLPPEEIENLIQYANWGDALNKAHQQIKLLHPP